MGRGNRNKRSKKSNNAAPAPKKKKKEYTKAQKLAQKRIAAKKESTKTTSGKTTSTSAQVAKDNKKYGNTVPSGSFGISQAGKDKAAINRGIAAAKKTGIPSGKNLKSGSFGISQAGKKQAAINRASVKKSSGPKFTEAPKLVAEAPKTINPFNIFQTKEALKEGEAAREGKRPEVKNPGLLDSILNRNSETQRMINAISASDVGNLKNLGIGREVTPFRVRDASEYGVKSPDTLGRDVSFGPVRDGDTYARNITNFGMKYGRTPEARGKAYEQSLNPKSFKGLSDGQTL